MRVMVVVMLHRAFTFGVKKVGEPREDPTLEHHTTPSRHDAAPRLDGRRPHIDLANALGDEKWN